MLPAELETDVGPLQDSTLASTVEVRKTYGILPFVPAQVTEGGDRSNWPDFTSKLVKDGWENWQLGGEWTIPLPVEWCKGSNFDCELRLNLRSDLNWVAGSYGEPFIKVDYYGFNNVKGNLWSRSIQRYGVWNKWGAFSMRSAISGTFPVPHVTINVWVVVGGQGDAGVKVDFDLVLTSIFVASTLRARYATRAGSGIDQPPSSGTSSESDAELGWEIT